MKKTYHKLLATAGIAMAMLADFVAPAQAQTQWGSENMFVLTDGLVKWELKAATEAVDIGVAYGRWTDSIPVSLYPSILSYHDTTIRREAGTHYLELVPASHADGTANGLRSTAVWTPRCVWQRSSENSGYYYQEIDGYRYWLLASNARGLYVQKVQSGHPLSETTLWYDWDFGAAIQESYLSNGRMRNSYYWLMRDDNGWGLSCNSYERPETIQYDTTTGSTAYWWYCTNAAGTAPAGIGAVSSPVDSVYHAKEIVPGTVTAGRGFTTLVLGEYESAALSAVNRLPYLGAVTATATVNTSSATAQIRDPYIEYRMETRRVGMNLSYKKRTTEGLIGSAGVPSYRTYYAKADNSDVLAALPTATSSSLVFERISFRLNNRANRYLSLGSTGTTTENTTDYTYPVTVTCFNVPPKDEVDTLFVTVSYANGVTEEKEVLLYVTGSYSSSIGEPVNAPIVAGAVFGGGRQASVTGTTAVTMHRCDTVPAVYGGNDISGQVQGAGGSTVTLGTTLTTSAYPVRVGSVYGGGNGYYNYQYQTDGTTPFAEGTAMTSETRFSGSVAPWGKTDSTGTVATGIASAYIPTIKKTHVIVAKADVYVDSLFGGAKNAYITGDDGTSVVIDQQDGVVYAEFGGNNYGGTLGSGKTVNINISGTRTTGGSYTSESAVNIANTYFHGYGRDLGVRYLFGGGNKVAAPTVNINMTGGMVDTLFAGGNSASVTATSCTVNCADANGIFINSTTSDRTTWVGGHGRYNVRCLFGGNNLADMAILPSLTLTAGGIGTVYGGGNQGAMNYSTAATGALATELATISGNAANPTYIKAPTAVSTHVEVNSEAMKIDYLYGGCRMADVSKATYVKVSGGEIGTLFGGSNIGGRIGSSPAVDGDGTYVVLAGGTVWVDAFAGSNGYYHCNDGTKYVYGINFADNAGNLFDPYDDYMELDIPTHERTHLLMTGGTVHGNVYGGANLAHVGNETTRAGEAHLTLNGGVVKNNVYGGGNMAYVNGLAYVTAQGNTVVENALYAGNDKVGRIRSYTKYQVYDVATGNYITDGNAIASDNTLLNKEEAGSWSSNFSTYVRLEGTPAIKYVYGSGNGAYNYGVPNRPQFGSVLVYCAGEDVLPLQSSTFIDINTSGLNTTNASLASTQFAGLDTVFGGGNGVGVESNVLVLLNAANATGQYVNTIFGGNNRDDMTTCVPDIVLKQGQVGDVYGGGNHGGMSGLVTKTDICSNEVDSVSTYILIDDEHQATVNGAIYGGCNMADVAGRAYVDIRGSHASVDTIYGGNNVSGHIEGNTRVDISAGTVGTVYGGSNGYYDYYAISEDFRVYPFGTAVGDTAGRRITIGTMPDVDSTSVNIFGGTVANVYGGGRMGDCRSTCVVVDDQACGSGSARITGSLFGGGEGIWKDLNRARRGNVGLQTSLGGDALGASYVHLRHAAELTGAKAYGGGRGGDVYNTYITAYDTWEQPFKEIYGGCWGSDVYGTAHLTMNGHESGKTAQSVYGGNDLTGNVYKCDLTINSGNYDYIYGAGNGDYTTEYGYSSASTDAGYYGIDLKVPNAEYVDLTFNKGTVNYNLYGGGKMGTTMSYKKAADGSYVDGTLVGEIHRKVADTALTRANAYADPEKYSYILVNVHGGTFSGNIYAGGAGKDKQIVYGLKELNMDQSVAAVLVEESVYGGSENVHDGYGSASGETQDETSVADGDSTTMRPSSILNIAGGIIENNVYGGGYLGNVYGSVFVNIGVDAIENSTVWTNTYKGTDDAYIMFKPGYTYQYNNRTYSGYVDGLTAGNLALEASVYGGANWGTNVGSYKFGVRGFWGGESRILIDGNGYKTDDINTNTNPGMTVNRSIIGSGTSATGGDVLSHVVVMNYGTLGGDCHATRELWSIQRADSLWLWNTGIHYTGATDAIMAYPSQQYTINRVKVVNARGYNIMETDALMTNIHELSFYTDQPVANSTLPYGLAYTDNTTLYNNSTDDNCVDGLSMCTRISNVINPTTKKYTALVVNNGVNVDIIDEHGEYGALYGFAYLMAEPGTNAMVASRAKTEYTGTVLGPGDVPYTTAEQKHVYDGGFMDGCSSNNQYHTYSSEDNGWKTTWGSSGSGTLEYEFNNYFANYRVWSIGNGKRSRYTVILAHANPSKLQEYDKPIWLPAATLGTAPNTVDITSEKLGLAHTTLDLPASQPGNYYLLSGQGIILRDDNSELDLADFAWNPVDSTQLKYYTLSGSNRFWTEVETTGEYEVSGEISSSLTPFSSITDHPGTTFGLLMASGANFEKDGDDYVDPLNIPSTWNNGATVVTGNPHVSVQNSFRSAKVGGSIANSNPQLDFFLTYDTNFSTTLLGDVVFQLIEYRPNPANPSSPIVVGTVDVVVSINTIIDIFTDQEYELLAMYNEGRTNVFTRKAVLPATLENRDLYLKSVKWLPTEVYTSDDTNPAHLSNGSTYDPTTSSGLNNHFNLTDDTTVVIGTKNVFSISIDPADNVSTTLTANEGWHDIYLHNTNLYGLGVYPGHSSAPTTLTTGSVSPVYRLDGSSQPDTVDLMERDGEGDATSRGLHLGQLDGRGLAALNVTLNFDGSQEYKRYNDKGYVGKAVLSFQSYSGDQPRGSFDMTFYVKTRDHGDTIYIASDPTLPALTYSGESATSKTYPQLVSHSDRSTYAIDWANPKNSRVGKTPSKYIQTFTDAFDKTIYEEGDVIAVIGQVDITPGKQQVIQGSDYYAVPVIRYEGHHHEYPGEKGVYRGTMINVQGGTDDGTASGTKLSTSFATRSIRLDGSSMGKLKRVKVVNGAWTHDTNYYPDTNAAYGPIIAVSNSNGSVSGLLTTVSLENNTSVSNNLNVNDKDDGGVTERMRGAINVTNGGELSLMNNVTVENNIDVNPYETVAGDDDRPYDGAVYVNHGVMSLAESHKDTKVTITNNYLMTADASDHVGTFWKSVYKKAEDNSDSLMRFGFDATEPTVRNAPLANVFLTRLPSANPDNKLGDLQSDTIVFVKTIPQGTKIGVTKWFPGIAVRDTIGIAVNPGGSESYLTKAITYGNFFSDGWYRGGTKMGMYDTLYNFYIDNNNVFLHRCATFRQQVADEDISPLPSLASVKGQEALQYHPLHDASCPTGGDTLLFNVQGGFMPYSYTWTIAGENTTHATTTGNLTAINAANAGNTTPVQVAIVDTFYTPYISMANTDRKSDIDFSVVATDVTGCRTKKNATVTLLKSDDASLAGTINQTQTSNADGTALATAAATYWTDGDSTHTALGTRYFKAIKITPMVWVKGVDASISAWTKDNTHIYVESTPADLHDFDNLFFCEGEVLHLSTSPNITSGSVTSDFIMWDFDPYYTRQAQYVVPSHSDTVIAYYGPRSYWRQVVNSTEKGGGYYDSHYYYDNTTVTLHPTVTNYTLEDGTGDPTTAAGYVTTYLGDVHIYNENGLAWFLSVVNGLNGTQSRAFFFNKVYLHAKENGTDYDMKAHLWTPVGTPQHRFRGSFIGTSSVLTDTVPASTPVIIKNIIVNEPYVDYCGFFGFLDEATIKSVELASAMVRGAQYVGSMAASAVSSRIKDVKVTHLADDASTMLVTHYASGGMVGTTDHSFIESSSTNVKYVGDAVYTGGMVGTAVSTTVTNSTTRDVHNMESVYAGGVAGSLDDSSTTVNTHYAVTAYSADDAMGSVLITVNDTAHGGSQTAPVTVSAGNSVTIEAFPSEGSDGEVYYFGQWSDGSTDNPYMIDSLSSNINLVAYFTEDEPLEYTVTVDIDPTDSPVAVGTVEGEGSYRATANGAMATLTAYPNENSGYVFSSWSWSTNDAGQQTSTDNPLTLVLHDDLTVTAHFTQGNKGIGGGKSGRKDAVDHRNYIQNNYVQVVTNGHSQRVGGLVGYAKNATIENNYVYGRLEGLATEAGVGAVIDQGTQASHNYYEHAVANRGIGQSRNGATATRNIAFSGQGNQVTLVNSDYGVNNLTRVLNIWVRTHEGNYKTWRSDLEGSNNGYPIFGTPDMIPVNDSLVVSGCDSVEWEGAVYLFDDEVVSHIVDSVMMVDSTFRLRVVVNHSSREQYSDSVNVGEPYSGHGFELTETEVALLQAGSRLTGSSTIVLTDTLQGVNGCDSIVTLLLTINHTQGIVEVPTESQVRVYPNPATTSVTVESSEAMSHVEFYDNEGRRLQDYQTHNRDKVTIDVSSYATGAYYLRIHTDGNVTIQKLIKK